MTTGAGRSRRRIGGLTGSVAAALAFAAAGVVTVVAARADQAGRDAWWPVDPLEPLDVLVIGSLVALAAAAGLGWRVGSELARRGARKQFGAIAGAVVAGVAGYALLALALAAFAY